MRSGTGGGTVEDMSIDCRTWLRDPRSGRAQPSSPETCHVARAIAGRFLRSPALFAGDDVGGVPVRPVVLRSSRLVLAVVLLCLPQKPGQRRDVQVGESSSGKTGLDLLEQPAVAVGIVERRICD